MIKILLISIFGVEMESHKRVLIVWSTHKAHAIRVPINRINTNQMEACANHFTFMVEKSKSDIQKRNLTKQAFSHIHISLWHNPRSALVTLMIMKSLIGLWSIIFSHFNKRIFNVYNFIVQLNPIDQNDDYHFVAVVACCT